MGTWNVIYHIIGSLTVYCSYSFSPTSLSSTVGDPWFDILSPGNHKYAETLIKINVLISRAEALRKGWGMFRLVGQIRDAMVLLGMFISML